MVDIFHHLHVFSSSMILSIKYSCNFNIILSLWFYWFRWSNTVKSGAVSGVEDFSGNILLLKLLRTFSLVSSRNPTFFRLIFSIGSPPLFISLNSLNSLLCSISASSINKNLVCLFLKNITKIIIFSLFAL